MFGRNLLHTRIRAAEAALADGRVDAAYECAIDQAVWQSPRGQQLADAVARPIMARARLAAQRGDYPAALEELDRLARLQRESADARALRQRALTELRGRHENAAEQNAAVERAAANLRDGRLESGRIEIERVADARQRARLEQDFQARCDRVKSAVSQAQSALQSGDVLGAVRTWAAATARHGHTSESDSLAQQLADKSQATCDAWWEAGRLDQLLAAEVYLRDLARVSPAIEPHLRVARLCREAGRELGKGDFAELRRTLLRLQAVRGAKWLSGAIQALNDIQAKNDLLLACPIGALVNASDGDTMTIPEGALLPESRHERPRAAAAMRQVVRHADRAAQHAGGAGSLLMLIDGGGSSLWLAGDRVRIGRAGSSAQVDVAIPADLQGNHADVLRSGDDYFLVAHGVAEVNHRPVQRVLLRDNDRIQLGSNAKLTFHKPSARSGSAVLKLHHRCRLPRDVSSVVLFRETALVGPQANCHVRTREGGNQVVVFARDGRFFAREAPLGNRGIVGDVKELRQNESVTIGDLRLTTTDYQAGTA